VKEIQQREFNRAIAVLEALGCEYKIITKTGSEFGGLEVAVEKRKRASSRHPYGTLINYNRSLLNFDLQPGDVQSIPVSDFDAESVRSSICSILTAAWGMGAYTTSVSGDHVDVMRITA
jgi:hypothetical protein